MKNIENPFLTNTYQGPEYFCNRVDETKRIISNIKSGNSTTLMAIRRIGKTGLIKHVFNEMPSNWKGIYIDILETENLNQFLNVFSTAILNAIPEKSTFGQSLWKFFKSLRPVIKFDALTGEPQAMFDLEKDDVANNITYVLQFLGKQDFKIVIAIDEFQQILNYPEKNIESWLRTRIQQLKNVVFVFSGSQQHLMEQIFTLPSRPFFRSSLILKLGKINKEDYIKFIENQFKKYNKEISLNHANDIIEWCNAHTYYVQLLCNRTFEVTEKKLKEETWKKQAFLLLKEQEDVFFSIRSMLTKPQWQLLKAIAHEGIVFMPTSNLFLSKYGLGTSATVIRSLKSLKSYQLIYEEFDENGKKYYSVYDLFFQRWVEGK